jgi:hypothetical protein
MIKINPFLISSICIFFVSLLFAVFLFWFGLAKKESAIWGIFCLVVGVWGLGGILVSFAKTYSDVVLYWQIAYLGIIFVPPAFYASIYILLNLKKTHQKQILRMALILACFFGLYNIFFPGNFPGNFRDIGDGLMWPDWMQSKELVWIFFYISFYILLLGYSFILLIQAFFESHGSRKNQLRALLFGSFISWIGAESNFLPNFRVEVYPFANFLIVVYPFVFIYAIFKHQFMNIPIAIKRGLVYSVLAAVVTAFYLIFIITVGKIFQGIVGYQSFIINLAAIFIIALLFNPLRNRIQSFLDRRFFDGTLESLARDKEKLRQNLFHAEKLAYVGQLASSIVHEIRNPLTVLKTYIEFMPQKHNDPLYRAKFQDLLPKELERIERVVHNLLDLARPRQPNLHPVNLRALLNSTLF